MRHKLFKYFLSVFLLMGSFHPLNSEAYPVLNGKIDLSNWKAKDADTIYLDGNWFFTQNKLVKINEISEEESLNKSFRKLPQKWNRFFSKEQEEQKKPGYGSFWLNIENLKQSINVKLEGINSAFELYSVCEGQKKLISKSGKIGTNKKEEIPFKRKTVSKSIQPCKNLKLLIYYSNFNGALGGIFKSVQIAPEGRLLSQKSLNEMGDFFVLGILLIMAIYHFGVYMKKSLDGAVFFFAAICLLVFFRLFAANGHLFTLFNESRFIFELNYKLSYLPITFGPILFIGFFHQLFPVHFTRNALITLIKIQALPCLFVVFGLAKQFAPFLLIFEIMLLSCGLFLIVQLLRAALNNTEYARACILSSFVIFGGLINDVAVANYLINSIYIFPYCLVIFIFYLSFILTDRFNKRVIKLDQKQQKLQKTLITETKEALRAIKRIDELEEKIKLLEQKKS